METIIHDWVHTGFAFLYETFTSIKLENNNKN